VINKGQERPLRTRPIRERKEGEKRRGLVAGYNLGSNRIEEKGGTVRETVKTVVTVYFLSSKKRGGEKKGRGRGAQEAVATNYLGVGKTGGKKKGREDNELDADS